MKHTSLQNTHWAYSTLWLCAMIWGGTFVFQKLAVSSLDPLLFNALRSVLSAVTLFPFLIIASVQDDTDFDFIRLQELKIGLVLGSVLWLALGFQQIGITTTTASKAALITGLYVLLVPLVMKVIFADRLSLWQLGVMLIGVIGLYFLITHTDGWRINHGDLWVLCGTVMWALHVSILGHSISQVRILPIAIVQMLTCALLSAASSFALQESASWQDIFAAIPSLIYTGLLSGCIAFTLQVYGQSRVSPSVAAIILSFEAVFGVWAGWYFLKEQFDLRSIIGAGFIIVAITLLETLNHRRSREVAQ